MHSLVVGVPSYFVAWFIAAGVCIAAGTLLVKRDGYPRARVVGALTCCALSVLVGSKLLYLAETIFFPLDDYVPPSVRGSLHGFRIPGGILLLALVTPALGALFRLPWRRFGDLEIPLMALALIVIRLGCFLNGCCFGKVSSSPWALSFPRESWVFRYLLSDNYISPSTTIGFPHS